MTRTLVTFYGFGGVAGLLACWGSDHTSFQTSLIAVISGLALVNAAVLARWGARLPRRLFHVPVAAASVLISLVAWLGADDVDGLVLASIVTFVAVDAYFFFPPRQAFAQLSGAVIGVTAALLLRGDVAVGTALALDAVVVAIGLVTRNLAQRASGASRDPLTGLANRRGFDDALQQVLEDADRTGQPMSAALLDLDHFKAINDSLGHEAGDEVLTGVTAVWRRQAPGSVVLARHGGDEFAMLLPGMAGPEALAVARALSGAVDVGVSVGVAQYSAGESAAQLMRRADAALYRAKKAGRGRCALDGDDGADRPTLLQDLQKALATDQLRVHYQPLVELASGRIFGVEALARWDHPERGPVSPASFIPAAEEHGVIGVVGEFVLRTALAELTEVRGSTGVQLVLGVNTSVQELTTPGYAGRAQELLRNAAWPATHLVFEVTESQLETDTDQAARTMQQLLDLGCTTAIDDFGVGYSSLSRLDELPVEHLKFDTSFIATITSSPRRAKMLASLIAMARGLDLGLVAEGVETAEQAQLLQELGCRYGQGWLYGRPMDVEQLVRHLRSASTVAAPVHLSRVAALPVPRNEIMVPDEDVATPPDGLATTGRAAGTSWVSR